MMRPPPARLHVRHRRLHRQDRPAQVDLQTEFDVPVQHGLEVARDEDCRVVDQDVETPPLVDDALHRIANALPVPQVEHHREGGPALLFDLGRDGMNRPGKPCVLDLFRARGHGNLGARPRQVPRDIRPDPAARPGDKRHLSVQRHAIPRFPIRPIPVEGRV